MKVCLFTRVIYDGNLTLDFVLYLLRLKPYRIFSYLSLLPDLVLYLLNKITPTQLANKFYKVVLRGIGDEEYQLFKINNKYKIDLTGFDMEQGDIILTGEPSFLVDSFIDRTKYKVICTEYDIEKRAIIGELNMGHQKLENLKKNHVHTITMLFVNSFKDSELIRKALVTLVVRNHEIIQFEQYDEDQPVYQMNFTDYIQHSLTNRKWLLYAILSIAAMFLCMIIALFLSINIPIIEAYIVSFFLWICITYYVTVTHIKEQNFNLNNVQGYLLGIVPALLAGSLITLILGTWLYLPKLLVLFLAMIVSIPFLLFELRFYDFD